LKSPPRRRRTRARSKPGSPPNPDDHEARFELAAALSAAGNRDAAADALLEIISRDREWNEGAARARFLQLLEAQGLADPWSSAQRRRLSALLFT
jgi:putative thioredoxin